MAYRLRFVTDLFRSESDMADSEALIHDALILLTKVNIRYLHANPNTPLIYQSGVRYLEEPPGEENWRDIPTCLNERNGDCEDLACWRAAEVNFRYKIPAYPIFTHRVLDNGTLMYHIRVFYPKSQMFPEGHYEDPSRILGMGGPDRTVNFGSLLNNLLGIGM